jgi:uncharacterized protein Yka (UPF0111/DUF47 family)
MAFSLIPREPKFFDLFDQAADVLTRAADKLLALVTQFDRLAERGYEIHQEEHACNEVVLRTVEAANESFVTPFDRENIHGLAQAVNDLVDAIEEAASRFEVFRIERPTSESVLLARILRDCCGHAADGIRLCRDLKNSDRIQGHTREVVRLESEADRLCRECDSVLFADPPDAVQLIKWRELYGSLKDAINACRRVAQALSEIVIKGA